MVTREVSKSNKKIFEVKKDIESSKEVAVSSESFLKPVGDKGESKIWVFSQRNWFSKFVDAQEEKRSLMVAPLKDQVSLEVLAAKRLEVKELNKRHQELVEETENKKSKIMCVQCKQKDREVVFLSCLHLTFCFECFLKFKIQTLASQRVCPICTKPFLGHFKIFPIN